ncbi:MAG: HRDC domain-containing protein, partial [Planctomycetes bacterium]|nr:HRDC domain-containing protein [Planctomycetota bacterium]
IGALEKNGLVYTIQDEFEKDGRTIQFKRACLTDAGRETGLELDGAVMLPDVVGAKSANKSTKRSGKAKKPSATTSPADPEAVETLKAWRLQQAKSEGVKAFRVFGNKTLEAIAATKPATKDELLNVPGIGPAKLEAYGDGILEALRG